MFMNNKTLLSICIPTFNRLECLENCLNSIKVANDNYNFNFEVCVKDNNPNGNALKIVNKYKDLFKIKYYVNKKNIGIGKNIFSSVDNAEGEFSWIIGNDDMLLPYTFEILDKLFLENKDVDYFFINSYSVQSNKFINTNQPMDINKLPNNMIKFSNLNSDIKGNYFDLVNHKICWDYFLGIFLSIFRTKMWSESKFIVDLDKISETDFYTNIYNTFPHLIIFSRAFKNSKAYAQSKPLSINLIGEREWADMYPFVEAVRIPQVLDLYRINGLPFTKYIVEKNYASRRILPGLFKLFFFKSSKGIELLNFRRDILFNLAYPSVYYYMFYYLIKKLCIMLLRVYKGKEIKFENEYL